MEAGSQTDARLPILVRPSRDSDVDAMLAIYRHHIRRGIEPDVIDSGAPEPDDLRERRKNMRNRRLPHVVATSGDGTPGDTIVGYAYAVLFRKRPAYRYTAKHSIYVHPDHLGRGVGGFLLQALIDTCAAAGFRQMIGYIDADNAASLALHQRFGFTKVAHLPAVAFRYGRWADSVMMQRILGDGSTTPPPSTGR